MSADTTIVGLVRPLPSWLASRVTIHAVNAAEPITQHATDAGLRQIVATHRWIMRSPWPSTRLTHC